MHQRVLIYGSCVSRDIFNIDESKAFKLIEYFARSSFASAFQPIVILDKYSTNLASPFQRRIVHADLVKELPLVLNSLPYDQILIDLIDERFDLFMFHDGSVLTLSNEFLNTGFEIGIDYGRIVKSGTDEFFKLWEQGWSKFVDQLFIIGKLDRIRVNRVFWAEKTADGGDFAPTYNLRRIVDANRFLQRLYERIALDIDPMQFMTFDERLLVGSTDHRWGLSPFHYVDSYYREALRLLSESRAHDGAC